MVTGSIWVWEMEKGNRMKRTIKRVMLLFLIYFFSAVLCAGCGKAEGAKKDEGNAEIQRAYPAMQAELRPAILQIFCGDYRGSGVVWEITDREVTVVSSAHLLKNGDRCEVLCHAGVYYEAKVEKILENCDIGFAVFPADDLKADGVELAAVTPSGRTAEELVQGEELIVYGSMEEAAADFVKGYLIEAESGMQIDGYNGTQPLLLGGIVMESEGDREEFRENRKDPDSADESAAGDDAVKEESYSREKGAVDAGMSGSGVFDGSGKLLGILAGGDGESGFVAVPVWQITEEGALPRNNS